MKAAIVTLLLLGSALLVSSAQLDEDFGYVDVRPGAHMFWVTYHVDQPGEWTDYPLIMWLQGGPGASGVGYGNFEELGPYYTDYSLREFAWTKRANLMFVDNPVGSGYSYVDSSDLYTTTNQQIADDLVALVTQVFADYPDMAAMPFYVMAESYGGKMTIDFALALDAAIKAGSVVCDFRGVGLGDSWISPMDSVNTWGSFLYNMGFVNTEGQAKIDESAAATQAAVDAGNWVEATNLWSQTETTVLVQTGGINFYNVLAEEDIYRGAKAKPHTRDLSFMRPEVRQLFDHHVGTTKDALGDLMNGPQATRWNIPDGVVWDSNGGTVFNILAEDFMKPVIDSVVNVLDNTNVEVSVFTGDLDLICDTPGTYRWIEGMNWSQLGDFNAIRRVSFNVPEYSSNAGYIQEYNNQFNVYTVLRSGHMIPIDAPSAALMVVDYITAPAATKKDDKPAVTKPEQPKEEKKVEEAVKLKQESTKPVPILQVGQSVPPLGLAKHTKEAKEAHANLVGSKLSQVTPQGAKTGKKEPLAKRMPGKGARTFGL